MIRHIICQDSTNQIAHEVVQEINNFDEYTTEVAHNAASKKEAV